MRKKTVFYNSNSFTYSFSCNKYTYGFYLLIFCFFFTGGCWLPNQVTEQSPLEVYQQNLNDFVPRINNDNNEPNQSLDILKPVENPKLPQVEFAIDPNTGQKSASLSIGDRQ